MPKPRLQLRTKAESLKIQASHCRSLKKSSSPSRLRDSRWHKTATSRCCDKHYQYSDSSAGRLRPIWSLGGFPKSEVVLDMLIPKQKLNLMLQTSASRSKTQGFQIPVNGLSSGHSMDFCRRSFRSCLKSSGLKTCQLCWCFINISVAVSARHEHMWLELLHATDRDSSANKFQRLLGLLLGFARVLWQTCECTPRPTPHLCQVTT